MATPEQPAGAARALDDLYRRHAAEVFRYTYAVLGNRADAEDVTQATFVNALRALERGEYPRKPANWLLAISHNLMRQRFRQERARPTQVLLDGDLPRGAIAEDDAAPSLDELVGALGRIPVSQREAIVMREFEGRSYAEIAEILGVTTSALETLLFRARRSLAEELDNLVTCARAEQDVSRLLDGRLSRRERKRLMEHVRTCPACARFEAFQRKQRRALKGLVLLPLPASLTLFKGVHGASAASVPTIGAGMAATAAAGSGAAASGGSLFGGLAVTGLATKAAVVVAAVAVAGGVSYEGATHLPTGSHSARTLGTTASMTHGVAGRKVGLRKRSPNAAILVPPGQSVGKKTRSHGAPAHLHGGPVTSATTAPHGKAVGQSDTATVHAGGTAIGAGSAAPGHTGISPNNAGGASAKKTAQNAKETSTGPSPADGNSANSGNSTNANGGATGNPNASSTTSPDTATTVTTEAPSSSTGNGNANGSANGTGGNGNANGAAKGNGK